MAERGRFELPVSFDTHPFQGCALGHYATSPELYDAQNVSEIVKKARKKIF